jgi:transglutaminase-like putative cysteine protease
MSAALDQPLAAARGQLARLSANSLRPAEGWSTLVLAGLVAVTTSQAVSVAGWGAHDELLPRLSLLGAAVGLLAARSPLRTGWAWLLGLLLDLEWTLLACALSTPGNGWGDKLNAFWTVVWGWIGAALREGASYEPLIVDLLLGFALFLVGFGVSWLVFRLGRGWWALIFISTFGVIHLSYATVDSIGPFLWSVFLGLLLVANLVLHRRQADWRAIGVPVSADALGWTLASATLVAGLVLVVATRLPGNAVDPALASGYQAITSPWKGVQRGIDRLVGGTRGQARPGGGLSISPGLEPREDFDLSDQPVLRIQSPAPLYWRSVTYDRYDGRSVQSTIRGEQPYDADALLPPDPSGGSLRAPVELNVTVLAPSATALFSADAPVSFSVPTMVGARQSAWDQAGVRAATALQRGQSYTARAQVSRAGWRELAEAGATYPDWTERYLELPVTLPERVGALGNRITQGALLPLDRALAIEAYLRGLTYSTHAVVPPQDRDWVDFLLFDSESGYCDYLATAMAVLLRTQGIPARVAGGFAPGELEEGGSWLVRESDAHSWVEAYFPNYGWQIFEPSAIRPRPERPESARTAGDQNSGGGATSSADDYDDDLDGGYGGDYGASGLLPGLPGPLELPLVVLATIALLLGILCWFGALAWEQGLADEPPPRRRYGQLRRSLRWGGWPLATADTPLELGARLATAWPELAEPLRRLVECHSLTTYGRPGRQLDEAAEAAWESLRRPLWRRLTARRLRQLTAGRGRRSPAPDLAASSGPRFDRDNFASTRPSVPKS